MRSRIIYISISVIIYTIIPALVIMLSDFPTKWIFPMVIGYLLTIIISELITSLYTLMKDKNSVIISLTPFIGLYTLRF